MAILPTDTITITATAIFPLLWLAVPTSTAVAAPFLLKLAKGHISYILINNVNEIKMLLHEK